MERSEHAQMILDRLQQKPWENQLGVIYAFEEYCIKEAYRTAKFTSGKGAFPLEYSAARFLITSFALQQEAVTNKPHKTITEDESRAIFYRIFKNQRTYDYIMQHDAAAEFFKEHRADYQTRNATLKEFFEWLKMKH